jgi:hypothetical protein
MGVTYDSILLHDDAQLRVEPSKTLFCVLPFMQSKKVHLFKYAIFKSEGGQTKPFSFLLYCAGVE